ncbi:MAG: GTPase domain-containing protein [bacterium]
MSFINDLSREIALKIVYYGPALSGKTTNLKYLYGSLDSSIKGDMISLNTKTERTLFFDFLPLNLGEIQGFKLKFSLYTVPGQVIYRASRELVLKNADGVVFVADSQSDRLFDNVESLTDLKENGKRQGIVLKDKVPLIFQYNKRDLKDILPIEFLEKKLNPEGLQYIEANAVQGKGVVSTIRTISKLILNKME